MNYKAMKLLNKIKKNKLTKEFYLTDIIQIAKNKKLSVGLVISKSEIRSRGINDLKTFYSNVLFFKKRFN